MPLVASKSRTLDQRRAAHAWDAVQRAKQLGADDAKKYGGQAKKLPVRILTSGLGPALAFLKAKAYAPTLKAYAPTLVDDLSAWLEERIPPKKDEPHDLLERIVRGDSHFLRRATDEALAYLDWLNRFAEAEGLTDDEQAQ
ncbi:MAG: type III-B CRISPR module-associated protein Cmr5 [Chloracidobacterium sp.]|nr:type III-B CRISPR module-associated protein Cmr5 [Chloracidobacterium sp.]MDW8218688.1 type III-B CRISPR module-associated protein Cmr5 [Acidobacteriota bacterium]